ncbi:MAG: hypothetical protein WCF57_18140 [Pyrinomonadaceae bacterium]
MTMRKTLLPVLVLIYLTCVLGCQPSQTQGRSQASPSPSQREEKVKRQWRAANYRGLVMGTSRYDDMLRALGEPARSEQPVGQTEGSSEQVTWYVYKDDGELHGELMAVVETKSRTILWIGISPPSLTKDEAIKRFGNDYTITKYHFEPCLGGDESGELYEAQDGALSFVEYRQRGIAIMYDDEGKVRQITYVSKPIGSPSSKCG